MTIPKITLTDAPTPEMRQAIVDGLGAFNSSRIGVAVVEPRPLALLLSGPDGESVVGGLYGSTWLSYLHVNLLFVPEKMRGARVGRALMMEAEAERSGADAAPHRSTRSASRRAASMNGSAIRYSGLSAITRPATAAST
jgi:hypothetical protein